MSAVEITRKDLILLARDRRAIAVLIILPMIFIAILGLSTGRLMGWQNNNLHLTVAVIDESNSEESGDVLSSLEGRRGLQIKSEFDFDQALDSLAHEKLNAVMVIGESFAQRVDELRMKDILSPESGRLAEGLAAVDVELRTRDSASPVDGIVRELLRGLVLRSTVPYVARKIPLLRRHVDSADETNSDETSVVEDSSELPPDPKGLGPVDEGPDTSNHIYLEIVPSYTVMFVFFLVTIMGRSFIQERELGTLRRLSLAPVTSLQVVIGKTLPFLAISLTQTIILFFAGRFLFGMPWGHQPLLLVPVVLCTSLAATGLGLLFSTLVRTDSQVSAYGNLIVLTMAGISGCFMPRDWLPETMQTISLVTPHAWSLIAYDQLFKRVDPNAAIVWQSCGMLLLFAASFLLLGWWKFRHET